MTYNVPLSPDAARSLILSGQAPEDLTVRGHLDLTGLRELRSLPAGLNVTRLTVNGCYNLTQLPARLTCFELSAKESGLTAIPADIQVSNKLDLTGCADLISLPENLKVGTLILTNCTKLTTLPEGLNVFFLDVSGCVNLLGWPNNASLRAGRLSARGCMRLTALPTYLTQVAQLDLAGCTELAELPEALTVSSWLDISDTQIATLPSSLQGTRLRWKGVLVNERIVFHPETLTGSEVLAESNAEVRRVMMERMGLERFFEEIKAKMMDNDQDPGGERKLLRVPLPGDEDLVCLAVACPSTGRRYVLRVPPTMRTCHQAAAWVAGFDDPKLYAPLAET